ncbi:hypothetical protein [Paraburkholderia sp. J12]|uniref:hypothetical protein n=1 Tax=Paraburkholderia sp. J12 TaxID=2805432 RepID=UPI002ABD4519|nr:hypothetical protein [Paraburkholderia sp. J12]
MNPAFDLSQAAPFGEHEPKLIVEENADLCTILAALRYYRNMGMGDPGKRPDEIHDLASGEADEPFIELDEVMGTYDAHWIDDLFDRLCGLDIYARAYNVIVRQSNEDKRWQYDYDEVAEDFVKAILATWDAGRHPYSVEQCIHSLVSRPCQAIAVQIVNNYALNGPTEEFSDLVDIARERFPHL